MRTTHSPSRPRSRSSTACVLRRLLLRTPHVARDDQGKFWLPRLRSMLLPPPLLTSHHSFFPLPIRSARAHQVLRIRFDDHHDGHLRARVYDDDDHLCCAKAMSMRHLRARVGDGDRSDHSTHPRRLETLCVTARTHHHYRPLYSSLSRQPLSSPLAPRDVTYPSAGQPISQHTARFACLGKQRSAAR
jgi:hypothetical protein